MIRDRNDALLPGFPYREFDFSQMFFLTFAQVNGVLWFHWIYNAFQCGWMKKPFTAFFDTVFLPKRRVDPREGHGPRRIQPPTTPADRYGPQLGGVWHCLSVWQGTELQSSAVWSSRSAEEDQVPAQHHGQADWRVVSLVRSETRSPYLEQGLVTRIDTFPNFTVTAWMRRLRNPLVCSSIGVKTSY